MPQTREEFLLAGARALEAFNDWCEMIHPDARADHLGYKCASREEFDSLRSLFEADSDFIYQSLISGRRIAIIKMSQSIPTPLGDIRILELSDQKPDHSQISGFDHVEMYPVGNDLGGFVSAVSTPAVPFEKTVRPHHTTYDAQLTANFKIRIEERPLIQKIITQEMNSPAPYPL